MGADVWCWWLAKGSEAHVTASSTMMLLSLRPCCDLSETDVNIKYRRLQVHLLTDAMPQESAPKLPGKFEVDEFA